MLNVTGKYVTVFNPTIKLDVNERNVFADISTSMKDKRNEIPKTVYMLWNARFVGDAFEPAKALRNKDKIDIIRGSIKNRYDKSRGKLYVDITIFEFAMSNLSENVIDESGEFDDINGNTHRSLKGEG